MDEWIGEYVGYLLSIFNKLSQYEINELNYL